MDEVNKDREVTEAEVEPKIKMPDTFIIIFFVVLAAAILTYIIQPGAFHTQKITYHDASGAAQTKTVLNPSTFHITGPAKGVGLFQPGGGHGFLNYVFEGLVSGDKWGSAVGVVAFILIIGGAFGIIIRTRAIEQGLLKVIEKTKGKEGLIIPILFILFSLGGAIFGMGAECIAFVMVLAPIIVALGYDAITCVLITYVASQVGFASSWMNPFGVALAQGIANVPVMSGAVFRVVTWAIFTGIGITFTWFYARRIKRNPRLSPSYESDHYFRDDFKHRKIQSRFGIGQFLVILTITAGVCWIIWGVVKHAYYIPTIASQFFTIGLVSGLIGVIFKLNKMTINDIAEGFKQGAKDLLPAALIVGMAKGIIIILGGDSPGDPSILNTVLHWASGLINGLSPFFTAWFMYIFQTFFNFFVVSGTGQAALTMPLLAPLSDLSQVTRQISVLAYQYGDGFSNMVVPTSAALMGVLGAARIDFVKWFKFMIPLQLILFITASIIIFIAVSIHFS